MHFAEVSVPGVPTDSSPVVGEEHISRNRSTLRVGLQCNSFPRHAVLDKASSDANCEDPDRRVQTLVSYWNFDIMSKARRLLLAIDHRLQMTQPCCNRTQLRLEERWLAHVFMWKKQQNLIVSRQEQTTFGVS